MLTKLNQCIIFLNPKLHDKFIFMITPKNQNSAPTRLSAKITGLYQKHFYLLLGTVLLGALLLRIWALLALKSSIYFDYLLLDEKIYHQWAIKIANGTYNSTSIYEFPPLPAYYNTHALILNSKGRKGEAQKYWQASSEMQKPFSAFANLSLARNYFRKHDYGKAFFYLDKIPDNSFAASHKYNLLGDLMMRKHRLPSAADAYQNSVEINSGRIATRRKSIKIYSSFHVIFKAFKLPIEGMGFINVQQHQRSSSLDTHKQVVEVMGDSACQGTDSLHPISFLKLLLKPFLLGNIS